MHGEVIKVTDQDVKNLVAKGMAAIEHDHDHLALVCFERAAALASSPLISSGLGYCLAAVHGEVEKGLLLCREAVSADPGTVFHYRNLGSVLLLAGKKQEAVDIFRAGLRITRDDGIIHKLDLLGTRKPPVFKLLSRQHLLNRASGLLLDRLGFR